MKLKIIKKIFKRNTFKTSLQLQFFLSLLPQNKKMKVKRTLLSKKIDKPFENATNNDFYQIKEFT